MSDCIHPLILLSFVTQCPLLELRAKQLELLDQARLFIECMSKGGVKFFSDLTMCSCITTVINDPPYYLWVYLSWLQRFNIIFT